MRRHPTLTDKTDPKARKARIELLKLQLNLKLVAEGLGVQARRDRRFLSGQAHREAIERRRDADLRRRPGYASVEANRPFEPDVRLIRAADRLGAKENNASASPSRPSYAEMREQQSSYPPMPEEAREYHRRKREERRRRNREAKRQRNGPPRQK